MNGRITDDPIITAQLASLLRRGLERHYARIQAGESEPSEIAREREEITAMLANRKLSGNETQS